MSEPRNGSIITFYSYKGGTGRSMLLANVAWILASHRKRVLMVDWDLEAPGLHRYFHPFIRDKYLAASPGLVDWVLDYQTAVSALDPDAKEVPAEVLEGQANLSPYLISIDSSELVKGTLGALHLLPAGRQDAGYPGRFSDLDFRGMYAGLDGYRFFELVKQKMKAQYDFVLIDSRTGVGDTSSICTLQMPDTLVVCFTLNSQSIVGASSIARAVFADRKRSAAENPDGTQGAAPPAELRILPVPTRIERSEKQKLERARKHAYDAFESFPTGLQGRDLERYWRSVEVPYEAYYAYGEVLAVLADQPGDITSVLASAERLTRYVAGSDYQELVRMPDERRRLALTRYSDADEAAVTSAERAERTYSGLSAAQEQAARDLFYWLVALGPDDFPFARPMGQSRVTRPDVAGVRDMFLAEGILAASQQSPEGAKVYELADPALVKSWSRIGDWVKEDLPFRRWYRGFSAAANVWHAGGQKATLVLEGKALEDASDWEQRYPGRVTPDETRFLTESRRWAGVMAESRQRRERRWAGRVRKLVTAPWYKQALVYAAIIAFGVAIYFGVIWSRRTIARWSASHTQKSESQSNAAYLSGLAKFNAGDYAAAIADFDSVLKYYSKDESALLKRGAAYRFLADSVVPDQTKREADLSASLADLNQAIALNGGAEEYYERGWTYYSQGNYNVAADDFKHALALSKSYREAHRGLAWVYDMQQRYSACLDEANAAIEIRLDYDALYIQALCLGGLSLHEEAIKSLEKVVELAPNYADALAQLGWEYNQAKQYDKSIEVLNKAIDLYRGMKREFPNPYDNRGDDYLRLGKYKEAIADFQKALDLGSTNTQYINARMADAQQKLKEQTGSKPREPSAPPVKK